ncbi:cell wall-binding repeat-containing protein [Kineococcus rhizosphaerae]|uniref:Putative cell wall binding repeat protein n=1 Tax=Kineococcus rhizosphaerae TaxID=559628 RepID=A0A2T0QWV2_9ACTN|nr:cell wall-binding repeat-containing protein [Kineococcus rhizosphaerae]PRY10049.1 putative cell wall binding repeat protein [Kineococcus rhizosphaerae]
MKKHTFATAGLALLVGLGGAAAVAAPAQAATGFKFDHRIAGADRFATAVESSKLLEPTDGAATDVVIVNGYATVDGLTASYLAGLKSAPILYTDTAGVPAVTAAEIARLGAKNVWIIGGADRVPTAQENAWKAAGKDVTRIAGADRYQTAALVAEAGGTATEGDNPNGNSPEQVFIASGTSTADALAAGPVAWAKNYPILLTEAGSLPKATSDALAALGTTDRVVLGSSSSVSDAVYAEAKGTSRLGGTSRQDTATKIADYATSSQNFDTQSVALVGGADATAADALSAAPVAGSQGVPLVFIDFDGSLGATTTAYLSAHKASYTGRGTGWIFGGTPSVPQAAADAATAAVQ